MFNALDIECLFEWHLIVSIDNGDGGDGRYFVWITKKQECKYDYGVEWHRNNNNNKKDKSLILSSKRCAVTIQENAIISKQNKH